VIINRREGKMSYTRRRDSCKGDGKRRLLKERKRVKVRPGVLTQDA
jgi:hypothetical protein